MARLEFWGATKTVTGSKYIVAIGGKQIMIDCGLFQGLKELRLRNWEAPPVDPRALDAVVLTHAHVDHTGYLPRMARLGYQGPVYATTGTAELCKLLLPDSGRLQEEDARYANKKGFSRHHPALPLYTERDALAAVRLLRPVKYEQEVVLAPDCRFRFVSAGHIVGSSFVCMELTEGEKRVSLVFSGDLGRYDVPVLNDPTPVAEADYIVVESTYGNRLHDRTPAKEQLADVIGRTAARGGRVIIPAFAVGRTQEILYYLRELEEQGRIPILPVIIDSPMAEYATRRYLRERADHDADMARLLEQHINPLATRNFSVGGKRKLTSGPGIIISASGMATGGRILFHFKEVLPDARSTVLFVGFQAEGTRGRRLINGEQEMKIHGEIIPVRAEIAMISNLSAHADYEETLRWLGEFRRPPRLLFITHGEPAAAAALAEKVEARLGWPTLIPDYGQQVEL